jgi:hypothetical protein
MHVGARLPYEGEQLESVVAMYAPVAFWSDQDATVVDVEVGTTGEYIPPTPIEPTLQSKKAEKLSEIAQWRYAKESSGIELSGVAFDSGKQALAAVSVVYAAMKSGVLASVQWKTATGGFTVLDEQVAGNLFSALVVHTQDCFDKEKVLVEQVEAALTIEVVEAIDPKAIFPEPFGAIPSTQI